MCFVKRENETFVGKNIKNTNIKGLNFKCLLRQITPQKEMNLQKVKRVQEPNKHFIKL